MAEGTDQQRDDRPECGEDGCGLPVISSEDGTTWYHWVVDPEDRDPEWGDSPVQAFSHRGGLHHAMRPRSAPVEGGTSRASGVRAGRASGARGSLSVLARRRLTARGRRRLRLG